MDEPGHHLEEIYKPYAPGSAVPQLTLSGTYRGQDQN